MILIRALLSVSFFLIITCQLGAQSFGVRGGINLSNTGFLINRDYHYSPDLHFGVFYDYPLKGSRIFETGLYLDSKGYRYYEASEYYTRVKTLYFDIPANLHFRIIGEEKSQLYIITGLYIGVGFFGKSDYGGEESGTLKYRWGYNKEEDHYKPIDFGLTLGSCLCKGRMKYSISLEQGLLNSRHRMSDYYNHIVRLSAAWTLTK